MAAITVNDLHQMSKKEVLIFIRSTLTQNGKKVSFDMSGYDATYITGKYRETIARKTGTNTVYNQKVLNTFSYLGIYDYTKYLYLDFYEGIPIIYYQNWDDTHDQTIEDLVGFSTSEIIYEIFKITILSYKPKRKRT
jgi:hypothetical protein